MRSYTLRLVLAVVTIVSSTLGGLYVDSRMFAFTLIGFGWAVHCLVKLLSGEQYEKKETFKETFEQFYGGPRDGTNRPSDES